jgi:hypothetical protein
MSRGTISTAMMIARLLLDRSPQHPRRERAFVGTRHVSVDRRGAQRSAAHPALHEVLRQIQFGLDRTAARAGLA